MTTIAATPIYVFLVLALVCCEELADTTEDNSSHTESSAATSKYEVYFGNEDYAPLTDEAIVAGFANSDPDFISSVLLQINQLELPAELHGNDLDFETCPEPVFWTGDYSRDLLVPSEYPTIQSAIDVAVDYQSVIVDPATTFTENLSIQNKFIQIFSASDDEPVTLIPQDPALPTVLFNCAGGGMLGGFFLQGGSVGVKASSSSLGMTTIVDSQFDNITAGIILVDTHFFLVDNIISGLKDGVLLVQATGDLNGNSFYGGTGIALYLDAPYGVIASENTFDQTTKGQGAVFIDGGAAVIKDNSLTLKENAFGVFGQFMASDSGASGLGLEILDNAVSSAMAVGLAVFGESANTSQAFVSGNTVLDSQRAVDDPDYDWLDFESEVEGGVGQTFREGIGIIVMDAVADTKGNTVKGNWLGGIAYASSCGSVSDNTAVDNLGYDLIILSLNDPDNCKLPTLTNNSFDTLLDDDSGEMAVANQPIETPTPP